MKVIILSAGRSPRLLPLTKDMPQSMLKVGQKTILGRHIEILQKAGFNVSDIIVVTGYLSEKLDKFCAKFGVKTLFNPFYDVSGIALSCWAAKEELKNGFIFMYSDIFFDQGAIDGLLRIKEDICLAIKKNGLREEAEKVAESQGLIKEISKTISNQGNGEFIGMAKFSEIGAKKFIDKLEQVAKIDINSPFISVISALLEEGEKIAAYDIQSAKFIDIDFPEDLKRAEQLFL
ncbi:MAG: phosphocholine cytidylyltransferase family protein [Patescibacteria group bacterium]|nr:phosphocholine cytidylyltransferase family protein [Patescibacteria group bacterium]